MIEQAIYSLLSSNSNLSTAVSGRIYKTRFPDDAEKPAVVFKLISTRHEESMTGSSGLASTYIELGAWATTADAAKNLGELIRLALQGYKGTAASTVVYGVVKWTEGETFEEELELYEHQSWCTVWHQVPQPS